MAEGAFDLSVNTQDKARWLQEAQRQQQARHAERGPLRSFMQSSRQASAAARRSFNDASIRGMAQKDGEMAVEDTREDVTLTTTRRIDPNNPKYAGMEF